MKRNIKKILCTLLSVLILFTVFAGCSAEPFEPVIETTTENTIVEDVTEAPEEQVFLSAEVINMAEDTKEAIEQQQDVATDEIAEGSIKEENAIEIEQAIEQDAQVEQEDVSYDGAYTGKGTALLGTCNGLTYYSQKDSRWANLPYTSIGSKSQTMSSSACGPTSAAMVVSSSKGAILPTTMAQLFVDNGYRTKNNGTAWACWSFVADYFDFKEYKSTTSFSEVEKHLETDKNKDGISDYFVVVSCDSGLFTSGGHYIVLVADNDNTLTVYDPYLYYGKFDTASRRAAGVKVSGNSAFVSETNFKKYANAKHYWIYSNDNDIKQISSGSSTTSTSTVKYTRYVATQNDNLNVRSGPGTNNKIVSSLKKGTAVSVTKTSGGWSYIVSPATGWVSTAYLSATKVTTSSSTAKITYKTTIGNYYRLKYNTTLCSNGAFTGTKYSYLANTQVKVISHYSETVDKVYIVKLGLYRYAKIKDYT